jgi:hypothetical protein
MGSGKSTERSVPLAGKLSIMEARIEEIKPSGGICNI